MLAVLLHAFFFFFGSSRGRCCPNVGKTFALRTTYICSPFPPHPPPPAQDGRTDTVLGDYTSASVAEPTRRSRNATPQRRG